MLPIHRQIQLFKYDFVQGGFTADNCEMCASSISIPYSWNNVSTYYNNKTFSLIFPTAATTVTYSFVLPEGFYTVNDINYCIQQTCISNGAYLIDSSANNVYFTNMAYNATYYCTASKSYFFQYRQPLGHILDRLLVYTLLREQDYRQPRILHN